MFHDCRVAIVDDENRQLGSVPVWFLGVGIISGVGTILSFLATIPPIFWGVVAGVTMDVWWYVFTVPIFFVCFMLYLWYFAVMDTLPGIHAKPMYPSRRNY